MMSFSSGHLELQEPHCAQYQMTSDLSSSTRRSSSPESAASTMQRGSYSSKCSAAGHTEVHMPHDRHVVRAWRATISFSTHHGQGCSAAFSYQARHSVLSGSPPRALPSPPLPPGLVRLPHQSPALPPVLFALEGSTGKALDVRVVTPPVPPRLDLIAQRVVGRGDLIVRVDRELLMAHPEEVLRPDR